MNGGGVVGLGGRSDNCGYDCCVSKGGRGGTNTVRSNLVISVVSLISTSRYQGVLLS